MAFKTVIHELIVCCTYGLKTLLSNTKSEALVDRDHFEFKYGEQDEKRISIPPGEKTRTTTLIVCLLSRHRSHRLFAQ